MGLLVSRLLKVDEARERLSEYRGSGVERPGCETSRDEIGVAALATPVTGHQGASGNRN